MAAEGDGPGVVRSVAVTAEDVVTAVEARLQRGERVVLRVTPPFSGRMRARLHVSSPTASDEASTAEGPESRALHVDPRSLLDETAPAYPRPADTEDALRADPDVDYSVERHYDRHRDAVASWRESVRDHLRGETVIETPDGPRTVDVVILG